MSTKRPIHWSRHPLAPATKLNPLMMNKGPCPTQEADDMDTMVLPQRHTRPRIILAFDGFSPKTRMDDRRFP